MNLIIYRTIYDVILNNKEASIRIDEFDAKINGYAVCLSISDVCAVWIKLIPGSAYAYMPI